jgi:hypothetical protein
MASRHTWGYHDDRDNILLDERSDDVKVLKAFRVASLVPWERRVQYSKSSSVRSKHIHISFSSVSSIGSMDDKKGAFSHFAKLPTASIHMADAAVLAPSPGTRARRPDLCCRISPGTAARSRGR